MPNREGCAIMLVVTIGAWWLIAAYWPKSFLVILAVLMLIGGFSIPHRRG